MKKKALIIFLGIFFLLVAGIINLFFIEITTITYGSPYITPRFSSKSEFINFALQELQKEETFIEVPYHDDGNELYYMIDYYVKDARGYITLPNGKRLFIIPHSAHENDEVGDISLARCEDKYFISRKHICGSLRISINPTPEKETILSYLSHPQQTWEVYTRSEIQ